MSAAHQPGEITSYGFGQHGTDAIYTPEERRRRDESPWTIVQGVLAPLQFLAFAVSVGLLTRYFLTGEGLAAAEASILVKTALLLSIMVTGAYWERAVFGRWLFVPAFFWEDAVSMLVIALHVTYVVMLFADAGSKLEQLLVALVAYAAYLVNAAQFLWKFRLARTQSEPLHAGGSP